MKRSDPISMGEKAVSRAIKHGAREVSVTIARNRRAGVTFRDGKIEQLKQATRHVMTLRLFVDDRYSVHTTNDFRNDYLDDFIRNAVHTTRLLAKDKFRSLPDPSLYPDPEKTTLAALQKLKLVDPKWNQLTMDTRMSMASSMDRVAQSHGDPVISAAGSWTDVMAESALFHSNGFSAQVRATHFSISTNVTVKDPNGSRPEDGVLASARFWDDLPDPQSIARSATQRAIQKIGPQKIPSDRYPVVVENRAVSRLLNTLISPMSGRLLYLKQSFLDGMVGKPIASKLLTITDDPFIEKGFGSRFFDGEGMAAARRAVVDSGILRQFFINYYYSKKLGIPPTSGTGSNLIFGCGHRSLDDMIQDIPKGVLITGFIGGNSSTVTGNFSMGITGHFIKDGQLVHPVREMNITDNAKHFWLRLVETGNDSYPYSSVQPPSMCFEDVNLSGL